MSHFVDGAKRVLLIAGGASPVDLAQTLPSGGMLIVMDEDVDRGSRTRQRLAEAGLADRATVILGDPARMLYKIGGPFDLIVCEDRRAGDRLRATFEKLLAPHGRLMMTLENDATPASVALDTIQRLNPKLNAFITVLEAEARKPAREGVLSGLPISIKDLIDVAGTPTTAASRLRDGHVAKADATVVERLRRAGAVIIGKANLHELALGTTNEESAYGPARNPYDPSRSPGGSSGGSAISVATGMSWASLGTDTGGSIRVPAAACGVVGLKPAFGEIPTTGVVPLSVSLDHVGPLARSVVDAWTVYEVLKDVPPAPKVPAKPADIRLGLLGGYFLEKLDDEVRRRFDEAINRLKAAGATIVPVTIPTTGIIAETYVRVVLPEAFAVYARTLESSPQSLSEGVRARLEGGRQISKEEYVTGQRDRGVLRHDVDAALSTCDALVLPTLPIPAPKFGVKTVTIGGTEEDLRPIMLRLTQLFNLTGHPAISLPCGTTRDGLPCGLQLVGRREGTRDLLSLSLGCETYVSPRERAHADGRDL